MGFFTMLIISLAITVAGELLRPKQKFDDAKPSALGDFSVPTVDPSRVIPIFWGKCKLQGPNCAWFGDLKVVPITKTVKTGWFSKDTFVQGNQYHYGMQLIWAWGKIDSFSSFLVDDREIPISGLIDHGDYYSFSLNGPTHLSADDPPNGITGPVKLYKGTSTQLANAYLGSVWTDEEEVSAFRRVCYAVLERCYLGNSDTPPTLGIVAVRTPNQLGLTGGKHNINDDANPACMCYEILLDRLWGLKLDPGKIDKQSFIDCGNTLFDEGMGLSMLVDNPLFGKDLLSDILRHVDGVIFADPVSGLYTMKLARADYDVETLPVFDDSNILKEGFEFSRISWEETRNTTIVNYVDRERGFQVVPVQYQDLANIAARSGVIDAETIDFLGFSNVDNAKNAAARSNVTRSSPLARVQMYVNREGYSLRPGSVFSLTKANYNLFGLVMRVIDVSYGTLDDPRIQVTATEDIFSVTGDAYDQSSGGGGGDDGTPPPAGGPLLAMIHMTLDEPPFAMLGEEAHAAMALAVRDDASPATGFEVWSDPAGGSAYALTNRSNGTLAGGTLAAGYSASTAVDDPVGFTVNNVHNASLLASITDAEREAGANIIKINNEYMAWKTVVDNGDGSVTISGILRAVYDTVPWTHAAGSVVYFLNESVPLVDPQKYADEVSVSAKLLAFDKNRTQQLADVAAISVNTWSRALRPDPPGKFRINGLVPGDDVMGTFTVEWEHRNKIFGLAVSQDATGIPPAYGTTYLLKIYNDDTDALLLEKANIAAGPATVTLTMTGRVRVELYSINAEGLPCSWPQTAVFDYPSGGADDEIIGIDAGPLPNANERFEAVRTVSVSNLVLSGLQTVSDVSLLAGDRVLVNAQTNKKLNGPYIVSTGAWTRALDGNESEEFYSGKQVFVEEGVFAGTVWALAIVGTATLGTTDLQFKRVGDLEDLIVQGVGTLINYDSATGKYTVSSTGGGGGGGGSGELLASEILVDAPIGFWKCDEASGDLIDYSGNGYDLTPGSGVYQYSRVVDGIAEKLYKFGGATRADKLGLAVPTTGDLSFVCLGIINEVSGSLTLFALGASGETLASNYQFIVRYVSSSQQFEYFHERGGGTDVSVPVNIDLQSGEPVLIGVTKDSAANRIHFYINGKRFQDKTYSAEPEGGTDATFTIGGTTGGYYAIFDSAISPERHAAYAQAIGLF